MKVKWMKELKVYVWLLKMLYVTHWIKKTKQNKNKKGKILILNYPQGWCCSWKKVLYWTLVSVIIVIILCSYRTWNRSGIYYLFWFPIELVSWCSWCWIFKPLLTDEWGSLATWCFWHKTSVSFSNWWCYWSWCCTTTGTF